jgi:methylated-DNA-[protein]-cysteine S-methyltransferase
MHLNLAPFLYNVPPMSFQELVYAIVKKIPKGSTLTYKQVAEKVGRPRAHRAVGNVLNKNIDPNIPCHRVIRSDGQIGGYRDGSTSKARILKEEGFVIAKL